MTGSLIERAQRGEEGAWETLCGTYADPLYRYIFFRVGMRKEDAEDLLQQTLMTAVEAFEAFRGSEAEWYRWCCGVAKNHVRHFFRSRGRRMARESVLNELETDLAAWLEEAPAADDRPPQARLEAEETAGHVATALSLLPPHYQAVLLGKYEEEQSVERLAEAQGCSVKAVESLLTRAREAFKLAFLRLAREEGG